ncbi:LacI family DNA-binding transcriptional regulator [Patulibacter defluvii]|uniref:LacI family DNA-binding transcriptional regulator n=1 Tax=Patulibacter defluvii TaxID=3095358 RepID=UPI002A752FE6|nr:LacI family DNA-binding transcriptional regulator [Patulibacter sp. DM4]
MKRGRPRPSIQDIADATGVSITTVSHALNGKGRVQAETRERVLRVADELGYTANVHAQRLATGRNRMLALQVSGSGKRMLASDSSYYVDVLDSAAAAALDAGYTPVIVPARLPERAVEALAVEGAIVIDPRGDEPLLRVVRDRGGLAVTAGRVLRDGEGWGSVDNDHRRLTRDALDHLLERGYRRPALLTGTAARSFAADAAAEYRAWAAEHGLPPIVVTVRAAPSASAAFAAAGKLLDRPDRPDAVYASFDVFALGVLRAAAARGLRVPKDVGIVATVDGEGLRGAVPPVSAFDLHPSRIGKQTVATLVRMLEQDAPAEAVVVPAQLRPRESTERG